MTENKRFIVKDIWIKDNCIGALLNIDFNTITDANLCCGLLNQIEKEKRNNGKLASKLLEKNEQLKSEIEKLSYTNEDLLEEKRIWKQMSDEYTKLSDDIEQLKKELNIYTRIATCSNCKYQDYDWFEDGDEFEICKKGNNNQQIEYHICKEWREF